MDTEPKYKDKDWLERQYVENDRTMDEIADIAGCPKNRIQYWKEKFDIQRPKEKYKDKEWLREEYTVKGREQQEIAEDFGCGRGTITYYVDKFDLPKPEPDYDKYPYKSEDWLREQYHENERSLEDIGNECNVDQTSVLLYMKKHDIPRRTKAESRMIHSRNTPVFHQFTPEDNLRVRKERCASLYDGDADYVFIHRLVGVAEYGFDSVCDKHIHHKNGICLDNRPCNLEPLSQEKHNEVHAADHERNPTNIENPSHL